MICDEVMAGFGRCGEWFAFQKWGVQPDLVCFAKGVNSGYLPLGGVVISQQIADTFRDRAFPGGLTYSGHPLACASAVASINIFKEEGIIEHARMLGTDVIAPGLEKLQANHPSVGEVRGLGVFWALELVSDRATRRTLVPYNAVGRRRQADGRPCCGMQAAWAVAVHPLQSPARRAAVHGHGRRDSRRSGNPRRGPDSRRLVLHRLSRSPMWRKPGRTGAILYALLAAVLGIVTASISRLEIERQRGRREAARLLPSGPIIVISNHTSYADGVLLALACRRMGRSLRLLATSGVFGAPLLGTVARKLGFIKVKRGAGDAAASLDEAAGALAEGEAVGLFPEGRLTRDPMMWPERAKTGTVRLALRTGAPIVPVAMVGAHRVVGRRRVLPTLAAQCDPPPEGRHPYRRTDRHSRV